MKDIHNKILYYFLSLLIVLINNVYSQETHSYNIDAKLDIEKNIIEVEQSIKFKNISNKNLTAIYLEDWSNSFKNNETNLASRITDEYDRRFSFSSKNRRGFTILDKIQIGSINLDWSRLINNNDIIRVSLNKEIKPNESELINLKYSIKIPDEKFTGYGYGNNSDYYLKNWIISISAISNNIWLKQSNLNLDDQSLQKSNYLIKFEIPSTIQSAGTMGVPQINHQLYAGYYLVSKIRHYIVKDDYKMDMELIKNSFAKRIPGQKSAKEEALNTS